MAKITRNQSFYMKANENSKPKSMECRPSGTRRETIPAGQSAVKTTRKEFSSLSVRPPTPPPTPSPPAEAVS